MSFSVDRFGMNCRAELKAYNMRFKPMKHLARLLRDPNEEIIIVSYSLPMQEWFRPKALDIRTEGITIIANSKYEDQAIALKQAYPDLRIFLDSQVHAKMMLASSGKVWVGSSNMCESGCLDATLAVDSPALHAFFKHEIERYHLLDPEKEILLDIDAPIFDGVRSSAEEDFDVIDDDEYGEDSDEDDISLED